MAAFKIKTDALAKDKAERIIQAKTIALARDKAKRIAQAKCVLAKKETGEHDIQDASKTDLHIDYFAQKIT